MKKLILIFLAVMALNASILDFRYLSKAKEAYENKDYKKAIEFYNRVEDKNDEVKFNLADAYYKNKSYKKALELYKEIKDKRLEFKKLHNIGNSLANLGKIDEAIKAYEKALQIKEDKDTRFNLELLKKLKRQKKKNKKQNKQNKKNNKNNKQNQKDQNKNQSDKNKRNSNKGNDKKENQDKNQNKKNDKNNQQNENKDQKNKKDKNKEGKKGKDKEKRDRKSPQNMKPKNVPISDMEVRKYEKMLNQRGVNTLLLPLNTKGENKNEQNVKPW